MSNQFSEIPLSPSTCLGLDMEEAVNRYPLFFAALATKVKKSGGRVVVIAATIPSQHAAMVAKLEKLSLPNDGVFLVPPWDVDDEEIGKECPYWQELEAYGSWFWLKAHIAEQTGVTHFVDEGAQLWRVFSMFVPNVVVTGPTSLRMEVKPASGSGNPYIWHCGDPPPYKTRYGDDQAESVPWQPTKAYNIWFQGDIEVIYQAVKKWNAVINTYEDSPYGATLVIPAIVTLNDINEILAAGGDGSFIEGWWEIGAHP
jgi:hypothetical protein